MALKVSSKYQVVIPEKVRQALNLKPGTVVDVIAKGGIAYIVPVSPLADLKKATRAKLQGGDLSNLREKKDRKV